MSLPVRPEGPGCPNQERRSFAASGRNISCFALTSTASALPPTRLGDAQGRDVKPIARDVCDFLVHQLGPHEQAEEAELYPVLAPVLGGRDPTGTMSRAHAEISHLIRRVGSLASELDETDPDSEDMLELRRLLYGLHAVLQLHFAQEDEGYLLLDDEVEPAPKPHPSEVTVSTRAR